MADRSAKLRLFLDQCREVYFRPGKRDCALFAADWIELVTGVDPAAPWRGRYITLTEGRALLVKDGYREPSDVLAPWLVKDARWMQARTGDVVVVIEDGEEALGIVAGCHIHVLRSLRGLDVVPLDRAVRVYRP